jgi:hypothetical protein
MISRIVLVSGNGLGSDGFLAFYWSQSTICFFYLHGRYSSQKVSGAFPSIPTCVLRSSNIKGIGNCFTTIRRIPGARATK